jgi:hypothetical protein
VDQSILKTGVVGFTPPPEFSEPVAQAGGRRATFSSAGRSAIPRAMPFFVRARSTSQLDHLIWRTFIDCAAIRLPQRSCLALDAYSGRASDRSPRCSSDSHHERSPSPLPPSRRRG